MSTEHKTTIPTPEMDAAAELLRNAGWIVTPPSNCRYGCFCDLFAMEPGTEPDGCVIDQGRPQDCTYARGIKRKEQCSEWKAWTPETLAAFWKEHS